MNIYIVRDDERNIDIIYDEETFKKEYKKYILTPPIYINKDFWMRYTDVIRWKLNTEESESINPEDMELILQEKSNEPTSDTESNTAEAG